MIFSIASILLAAAAPAFVRGMSCDLDGSVPIYHEEFVCDRYDQNNFHKTLTRRHQIVTVQNTGASLVPNEKNVMCPQQVQDLDVHGGILGLNTRWLVENTASTDIVVAWVKDGVEYSAAHSDITPPHHDPDAMIPQGYWRNFDIFEGQVFHVRQVLPDGSLGDVLYQHRAGLIPITKSADFFCDPTADPEPLMPNGEVLDSDVEITTAPEDFQDRIAEAKALNAKVVSAETGEVLFPFANTTNEQRAPEFVRTPPKSEVMRPCNTIDLGFRNEVGCPINGYWFGAAFDENGGGLYCKEQFQFHLGLNLLPDDFMWDWESATKFQESFIGHTYVFRLASDTSTMVGSYTLAPTKIVDCPGLKQVNLVSSAASAILNAVGRAIPDHGNNVTANATNALGNNRTFSRFDSAAIQAAMASVFSV